MKKIQDMVHFVKKELKMADKYYTKALIAEDKACVDVFKTLAEDNIDRVNKLHKVIVSIINDFKSTGATVPPEMAIIWNYEHEEMIKDVDEMKEKLSNL